MQGGAERMPTTCPLCMEQACPLHILLWSAAPAPISFFTLASLEGENDQISIFFLMKCYWWRRPRQAWL